MVYKEKEKRTQIEAIIQEAEAEVKHEIVTTDEIKVKATKGLYFHQEIAKTEAREVEPRIIMKKMIKRKETFFQKEGQLQKYLKSSKSQLMGIIVMLDSQSMNIIKYTLFLRYNLVKTTKMKMCK